MIWDNDVSGRQFEEWTSIRDIYDLVMQEVKDNFQMNTYIYVDN